MKTFIASCVVLFALAGTAAAQDDDDMGMGGDTGGGGDTSMGTGDSGSSSSGTADTSNAGSSDDGAYKMGISTTWPTGGAPTADILYSLGGANWLDLSLGINFNKGTDPATMMSSSRFGIDLGVGYRMYKENKGAIRPYLEPAAFITIGDFSDAGNTMQLGVGALMGVDLQVLPQLTFGTGIGAGLTFGDGAGAGLGDAISFGLLTASINATFWW